MSEAAPVAVIGCGNPTRSDDGVGPAVIRRLAAGLLGQAAGQVRLFDAGTDGPAVMFAARGCRRLVIVDACRSGAPPGAVFEVPADALAPAMAPPLATHDFRWDHALAAGRRIYGPAFPREVTVYLIEAGSTGFGLDLSAPVAAAVERVAATIEAAIA